MFKALLVLLFALPAMSKTYTGTDNNGDACWLKFEEPKVAICNKFAEKMMTATITTSYTDLILPATSTCGVDNFNLFVGNSHEFVVDPTRVVEYKTKIYVKINDSYEPTQFRGLYITAAYDSIEYKNVIEEYLRRNLTCSGLKLAD